VIGAPNGGPLCILRSNAQDRLVAAVFSQSGALLHFALPSFGLNDKLARGGAGWTTDGMLVLVAVSGRVSVFSNQREAQFSFPLAASASVIASSLVGSTLAAVATDGSLHLATKLADLHGGSLVERPRLSRPTPALVRLQLFAGPQSAARAPIALSSSRNVVVMIMSDGVLLVITPPHASQHTAAEPFRVQTIALPTASPPIRLAPSPSGEMWALFTRAGQIVVMDHAFATVLATLDTEADLVPNQFVWCGNDAVAAAWPSLGLLVVGPSGDWVKFVFGAGALALVGECDSLRVLTATSHELLERVPSAVDAVFRIGSFAPASMLLDACEQLQDSRSDDVMRSLQHEGTLVKAVTDCIRAALCEFDVDRQRDLLRAAAAGKVFLVERKERRHCAKVFSRACVNLRILNVIRHQGVGMALTADQLDAMGGIPALAARLAGRGLHFMALKVCDAVMGMFGLTKLLAHARLLVVEHWAVSLIVRESSDQGVKEKLMAKPRAWIRFAELAVEAELLGRHALAVFLAQHEPVLARNVAALLVLKEEALARTMAAKDAELACFAGAPLALPPSAMTEAFVQENKRLMAGQSALGDALVRVGMSLADTVRALTVHGEDKLAQQVAKDFSLSSVQLWVARVNAFSVRKDMAKLLELAREKPARVGIVVEACLRRGMPGGDVARFARMIANVEERVEALYDCGMWREAMDVANAERGEERDGLLLLLKARHLVRGGEHDAATHVAVEQALGLL